MTKILVVNDHGNNRYILPAALESLGHCAIIVTSLRRVMAVYQEEKPDLVLIIEHQHNPAFPFLEKLANDGVNIPIGILVSDGDPSQTPERVKAYRDNGFPALSAYDLQREADAIQQVLC